MRLTTTSIYSTTVIAALGLILLAYLILRQIALRERYTRDMRAREEWFRVTLTSIGDAVIATDQHRCVTFMNSVAENLTGITTGKALGEKIDDVFPIFHESTMLPVENPVAKVIAEGRPRGLANHTVLRHVEGALVPIDDSAAPIHDDSGNLIGVVLVFRDITQASKTERVLRNAEKLASAARLSATVAHEINNPLEAAVNLIYVARTTPDLAESVTQLLGQAEHELERVAHITRQTLGFFRDTNAPGPVELEPLIESVIRLYSNKLLNKGLRVVRNFGECPEVRGVQSEIKQVVSNLLSNAADAAPNGGTITITLAWKREKPRVHMTVEDDGPGVAEDHKYRIFEPFFTTKQEIGTGLGLWVSRTIVERHGGTLNLAARTNRNGGAAFEVVFDAAPSAES